MGHVKGRVHKLQIFPKENLEDFSKGPGGPPLYACPLMVFKLFGFLYYVWRPKLRFPGRDHGPGRYREVREAYRIRVHLFSSRFELGARSFVQATEKATDY